MRIRLVLLEFWGSSEASERRCSLSAETHKVGRNLILGGALRCYPTSDARMVDTNRA